MFPSSEGKYNDGLEELEKYAEKLKKGEANFYTRADNLIPLLALTGGALRTEKITGHMRSGMYVCEKFLNVRFEVDDEQKLIRVGS